ncbi:MAG: HD family phosphohydrolase [Geobacter sp.]|nr:MAG: HD family phosphohydrolase [Geobacter sp.]
MGSISLQNAQRLTTLISGATKGLHLYPEGHPAVVQPLQQIYAGCQGILSTCNEIHMGIVDGILFVEEHLFVTPTPAVTELAIRLEEKQINGITICRGVSQENLSTFISLLAQKGVTGAEIARKLEELQIASIKLTVNEETNEAAETYGEALGVIRDVLKDIEEGRIPSGGKVIGVVKKLVTLTMKDPSTMIGLSMIKDYDNYTFNHSVNVGVLSMSLTASLGFDQTGIEEAGIAGFLHDVGKTQVDKQILNKPGKLSAAEFDEMKKHPEYGAKIISEMEGVSPQVAQAVLGHHIRCNRLGYPEWARKLPFDSLSEIIAVSDCYDAITTLRVYQNPMNPKAALDQIKTLAGSYLDSNMVQRFVEMMGKYPVGTLVRLDNNEIALVVRPNPANHDAPIVKVVIKAGGEMVAEPPMLRLADEAGNRYANIVAVVDPLLKNIDVARYLK